MWIVTREENGLYCYSGGKFEISKIIKSIDNPVVTTVTQDSAKNMWFALDNGITILHDGVFSYVDTGTLLADDSVNDIMEDHENNIWLALDRGGIQKLSHGRFQTTNTPTTVNAIAQDKFRDVVWFGCDDGLYCYKNNKFISNEITEFCKDARIRHVGVTAEGAVLVSAYEKLGQVKFNLNGTIRQWKKEDGLAAEEFTFLRMEKL